MRLLLSAVLLAAALGGAYLLLREGTPASVGGTGPAASAPVGEAARPTLDLARGETSGAARAAVATPDGVKPPVAGASAAGGSAPADLGQTQVVPEPSMKGGVTVDLVGSSANSELAEAWKLKYQDWSRAERIQAVQTLRTTLEYQRTSTDKDVLTNFGALKEEMGWLESNLDG